MSDAHFDELKEWSARKHELLTKYIDGFTKIVGGTWQLAYYVDGFAGPGMYGDSSKGSPLLIAEYAQSLIGKHYRLRCINVEIDDTHYQNLVRNTDAYQTVTTNLLGAFADNIDQIMRKIGNRPAIFFLDPFGIKGIEWQYVSQIIKRQPVTELLLRINPSDLQRLAGFINSEAPGAASKCQLLTDLLGFSSCSQWEHVWHSEGVEGLVLLYMKRLGQGIVAEHSNAYVCKYPIKTIEGELKYYLIFATRHAKGAVLMNDTVYNREETYERKVKEYQALQPRQLRMFSQPEPTEEEIFEARVNKLKNDIWQEFQGRSASRLDIQAAMFQKWFGKIKGTHFTRAFKEMKRTGQITKLSGAFSRPNTVITFKN